MSALNLRSDQRQHQSLSPRLQRAVRLLQMSSLDFATQITEAVSSNPFLEEVEAETEGQAHHPEPPSPPLASATLTLPDELAPETHGEETRALAPEALEPVALWDGSQDDRDLWHGEGGSSARPGDDGEFSAIDLTAAQTPLNEHLHRQLNLLPLPARDLVLAKVVVESLDDDGYLREALDTLRDTAELTPEPTLQELQTALKRVQSLDPAGVGARDVAECIALQLPTIDCPTMRALAHTVVRDHLETLAARDTATLARRLQCPLAQMQAVCDRIRRLDPRPGWRFSAATVRYVVPDVVARKHRGEWTVQLNPAVVPKVCLNRVYATLFERHRTAQNVELARHLQEARWTLRNIDQRFLTILSVAQAIVARQRHFLDFGAMAMKPLGLREIADEVGLHESTVSRVTNNKYLATPSGVYELKYFFSRAMVTSSGKSCSGTAIRGVIKAMIESERAQHQLSDAEITRQLAQQGLVVARRTVTKYRQLLRIESVDRRRRQSV